MGEIVIKWFLKRKKIRIFYRSNNTRSIEKINLLEGFLITAGRILTNI